MMTIAMVMMRRDGIWLANVIDKFILEENIPTLTLRILDGASPKRK